MSKHESPEYIAKTIFNSCGERFLFFQNRFHYCRKEDNLWEMYDTTVSFLRFLEEEGLLPKSIPTSYKIGCFKESRSKEWTPIFVGPIDKRLWITGAVRENHQDLRVFELGTSFVKQPTLKHEKKLDFSMRDKIAENKEGILRTLLEYAQKHVEKREKQIYSYKSIQRVKWWLGPIVLVSVEDELNKF